MRNGANSAGTPTFRCRGCGRRFVETPAKGPVTGDQRALAERLLGERMSLRGIARVTGRARSWLQQFANWVYREDMPHDPGPLKKKGAS